MESYDDFIDIGKEEMVTPEGEVELKSEIASNSCLTIDPLAIDETIVSAINHRDPEDEHNMLTVDQEKCLNKKKGTDKHIISPSQIESLGDLKVRKQAHSGKKIFQCELCNYKSSRKGHFNVHMRTHNGEKPFQCELCNYKCSPKSNLKVHMQTHSGEKPFQWELCNYKSSRKGYFNVHMQTHSGEKPFQCRLCNYKCSQKGNLKFHMQKHCGGVTVSM